MPKAAVRRSRPDMVAETRSKLVGAARAAFAEKGYAATSMDDLTAAAGLTRGALYHHFGGKEGLLEAVVRDIDAEMAARYAAEFAMAGGGWAGFRACGRSYLRMALEPEIQRIVLRDAPAVLGERWREIDAASALGPMRDTLAGEMARKAIAPCDPEVLARLLNGALLDAALWIAQAHDPEPRLSKAIEAYDVILDGLVGRGEI